eukprot:maker-scaffold372_size192401-snap-gene-0.41 protein:Tk00571 transcript:maker-scaffold372_size192401-snap-gene-0.41-mRNA-1 annotation:"thump domain-containing protein 3-like"
MAEAVRWEQLQGWRAETPGCVTLECTVVTGFEEAALAEVRDVLGLAPESAIKHRGRVFLDIEEERVSEVLKLRTIDNVWIMLAVTPDFELESDPTAEASLAKLATLLPQLHWQRGIRVWRRIFQYAGPVLPEESAETPALADSPAFRCTCYRSGERHHFSSMDAARTLGGTIQDMFQWRVKMKDFDIEVVVNIDVNQVYWGLSLTHVSLFRRNIEFFGPTTLRATICSGLLKMANIQPGDVVVDPMCGGGSIPIEGALGYPGAFYMAGDLHELARNRTRDNVTALQTRSGRGLPLDTLQWDCTQIPLREASVDVFVTDLSTGKINAFWKTNKYSYCNIGGLAALVFVMTRTDQTPTS